MIDYWISAVEEALDQVGVELSIEKIETMAQVISDAESVYSEYSGEQAATRGLESDVERELRELKEKEESRLSWINTTKPCRICCSSGTVLDCWGRIMGCRACEESGRVRA